jgi:D-glycero-alpha-D-manno-heptose-7-phosphate kinase
MLLFVPPARQRRVREALAKLIHVPFKFEFAGTQVIFFDPEEDYSAEERRQAKRVSRAFRELAEVERGEGRLADEMVAPRGGAR